MQEIQSTFQLWEIGGGRTMVRMADICLTPESVQRAMAVVVVDLSKPARVVDDLQFWLGALKAQVCALALWQNLSLCRVKRVRVSWRKQRLPLCENVKGILLYTKQRNMNHVCDRSGSSPHCPHSMSRLGASFSHQVGACLKQNPRAAPALLDRARARFKAANGGDHKDLDKVDLFPIPLLIVAAKYDAFKEREKEWRGEAARVMARTLRCLAHANGASLLYTAAGNASGGSAAGAKAGGGSGGKLSLQAFRVRFKSFLMQQAWPKSASAAAASESSASDSKEQIVQAGCDFFERIGAAPPPHDNSRNLPAGWVAASAACFVDKAGHGGAGDDDEDAAAAAVAGGDEADREPQIDAILAQKNDELARHLREAALKQKMDTIDLQQSS